MRVARKKRDATVCKHFGLLDSVPGSLKLLNWKLNLTLSVFLPLGIEIGFTQERVNHSDCELCSIIHFAVIRKSRPSEQTFRFLLGSSTPRIPGLGEPATQFGDFLVPDSFVVVLGPGVSETRISYLIVPDGIPERTEIFEISSCSLPDNPAFDCDNSSGLQDQDCCSVLQVLIVNDDGELMKF